MVIFQMILFVFFVFFVFSFFALKQRSRVHIIEPHHEKTNICTCENKDADQVCGNHEANQRLCFRYMDSKIPLLSKSEIFCSCTAWFVFDQVGNHNVSFLMTRLISEQAWLCRTCRSPEESFSCCSSRKRHKIKWDIHAFCSWS